MAIESQKTSAIDMADLKLFGQPPILSSENDEAFYEILDRLMHCFRPRDFLAKLLIWEIAVCTWEQIRCTRHKTLTIERRFHKIHEQQALRIKASAQKKAAPAPDSAEKNSERPTIADHLCELEDQWTSTPQDIDKIFLDRPALELAHARAFESAFDHYEKLDRMHNSNTRKRDNALERLERHQKGSGGVVRKASDEIIEAECLDVAAQPQQVVGPPLAPDAGTL